MNLNVLYIGIDVSKLKHDLAVMNEDKELPGKPFVIAENFAGYSYPGQRLTQLRDKYQIRYGQNQWRIPESFILKVKQLATNSIGYKSEFGAGWVVQSLIRTIHHYQMEIEFLKEQIKQRYQTAQSRNADILTTIGGVTKESAIILDAYFGDVHRFKNKNAFVAFFGMNPVVDQSGKQTKRKSRLEKKGSGVVRHQLFLIALNQIRRITGSFSWLDHRLISDGHLLAMTPEEMLLYFFLVLVGDKNGVSFYCDDTICTILKFDAADFIGARDRLVEKAFIAWDNGRFQVLQLPSYSRPLVPKRTASMRISRGQPESLAQIFQKMANNR
jgi:hypothetical protein